MTAHAGVGCALAIALLWCACGGPSATPQETVELYLHSIAHDPIRTLPLISPAFHSRHGFRFEDFREAPKGGERLARASRGLRDLAGAEGSADEELELARAQVGWLTALSRPIFRERAPLLSLDYRSERIDGDRAEVVIRAFGTQRVPIEAVYHLSRPRARAAWRIERIEVDEREGGLMAAFLVAPTSERWRRIEATREAHDEAARPDSE